MKGVDQKDLEWAKWSFDWWRKNEHRMCSRSRLEGRVTGVQGVLVPECKSAGVQGAAGVQGVQE